MQKRFTPILLILVIIVGAILSRFIGGSDYLLASAEGVLSINPYNYKNSYCPYNRLPYTSPTFPYKGLPSIRVFYPTSLPWMSQYPCPCNVPALMPLFEDTED